MKHVLTALFLSLGIVAAQAEEPQTLPEGELFDGFEELAEGMKRLLEGFQKDVSPLMEDLGEQLRGLNAYHPPEILPNGDIIIRRKTPDELTPKAGDEDGIDI